MKHYSSEELQEWDKEYLWHPFTQMQDWIAGSPIIFEKGEGNYLSDTEGNKYLDLIASLWVNIHGHNCPEINQAIKNQVDQISHSTLLGFSNIPSIKLAKQLVEISPPGLKKVFFSDNGSTAVEIALKMAFQFWQQQKTLGPNTKTKKKFITFSNSYHGDTIGSVSLGGIDLFHKTYGALLFETIEMPYPCPFHWQGNKQRCMEECLVLIDNILKESCDQIAGIVIEPLMQGAAGMMNSSPGFLKKLRLLCDQYAILLIFDEVATGFGRTGTMFACQQEGVTPDIMAVAKGITGGYLPLAATLTSREVFDAFLGKYAQQRTFFHGHSYTGNQLACAAALANLELFEKNNVLEKLADKISVLTQILQPLNKLDHVGNIRQTGLMVGIELVKCKDPFKPFAWEDQKAAIICKDMIQKGFLLRPLGNVIVLMPPLSITVKELKLAVASLYESIRNKLNTPILK